MHACTFSYKLSMISKVSSMHVLNSPTFWSFILLSIKLSSLVMFWRALAQKCSYMSCFGSFINSKLSLCIIGLFLGHNFLNWSFKHVVLWVTKGFSKFWPRKMSFGWLKVEFHAWRSIWIFQKIDPRSSGDFHARAWSLSTCTSARAARVTLEREMHMPRSSCVLQSARAREFTLERGPESYARAKVERPSSVNTMQLVLFMSL